MKKLLIDLDDVLAIDGYLNMLNAYFKTGYKYQDIKGYYVEELLTKEQLKEYRKFFKNNNVYDYARAEVNSKYVLMKLMTMYDIYVCSKYYSDLDNTIVPELLPRKCEFVIKNYPFLDRKNFIFTNDKSMIEADAKIDDSIDNLTGSGVKLLYTAYHNRNITKEELDELGIKRVNNWLQIEEELMPKQKVKSRI